MVSTRQQSPKQATPNHKVEDTELSSMAANGAANGKAISGPARSTTRQGHYAHRVPPLLMIWLYISVPLVIWDTGYISLRPLSMPGGRFHSPIWKPYALYGTVDYIYGWPAWNGRVGFTAAQGSLNVVETLMYIYYMIVVWKNARGSTFRSHDWKGFVVGEADNLVTGPSVAKAVLILFSATVMTLSKTVLYWLNEYFSHYSNVGHNTLGNLILLWIIPNGLWLIFPTYMVWVLGKEIVDGMDGVRPSKEE